MSVQSSAAAKRTITSAGCPWRPNRVPERLVSAAQGRHRSTIPREPVPSGKRCTRLVRRFEEGKNGRVGVLAAGYVRVREHELAEPVVVEAWRGVDGGVGVAVGNRVHVCVEGGPDPVAARPPAGAADLVRVRLHHHPVRTVGNAAWMARRRTSGETRGGDVEAAPEEVHRAGFAKVAALESGQNTAGVDQGLMERPSMSRVV